MESQPKHISPWIAWGIVALTLGIALFCVWYYYFQAGVAWDNSATHFLKLKSKTPKTTTTAEVAQNGAGWKIFKNFTQGYLIEYPDGATITNAGEGTEPATSAGCVKIATANEWVVIAGRNLGDDALCLRSGFGTEWTNAPDETVTAAGPTYTAHGMYKEAASLGNYEDDYMITVSSGEKIEYGIKVNEKTDPSVTKAQAKNIVHKMVASFSPAE